MVVSNIFIYAMHVMNILSFTVPGLITQPSVARDQFSTNFSQTDVTPIDLRNITVNLNRWWEEIREIPPNKMQPKPTTNQTVKSRKRRTYASPIVSIFNPDCDEKFRSRVVTAYTGSGVVLMCDPCGYVKEGILWTKLPLASHGRADEGTYEETVIPDNENEWVTDNKFYGENNALGIIRVTYTDNGIYQCKVKEFFEGENVISQKPLSYYYVEVKTTALIDNVVLEDGGRPRKDSTLPGRDPPLVIYSLWSLWSECDMCDTPGVRTRLGYCYTLLKDDAYAGGIPCHSDLIPENEVRTFSSYQDQRLIMPCVVYCSDKEPLDLFEGITYPIVVGGGRSYKKHGKVGNIHAGIQFIRVEEKSPLRLECPGAYLEDIVRWRIGEEALDLLIEDPTMTGARMFMDPEGSLTFRRLYMNDTNAYICEVNRRTGANYRVQVFKSLQEKEEVLEALGVLGILVVGYTSLFLVFMGVKLASRYMT